MLAASLGLVLVPACLLIVWITTPVLKDIMVSVTESWGVEVGLSGFALLLCNIMPFLIPLVCFALIIAGIIGLARGRSNV